MHDQFDRVDIAETRLAYEQLSRARAEAKVAVTVYEHAQAALKKQLDAMRSKYGIGAGDSLDPVTFEIKRAPKP